MSKLNRFKQETHQLDLDEMLAEIETEEAEDGNGQMRAGWMWLDADKDRSLEEKVRRAAEHFRAKWGRWPDMCYVNRLAAPDGGFVCGKVRVVAVPNILPHHFWMGPLEEAA